MERACRNCEFWVPRGRDQGRCQRYAPRLVVGRPAERYVATWPRVQAERWCGEFSPRTEPVGVASQTQAEDATVYG